MATIVLDGLDARTGHDLASLLTDQGHRVTVGWQSATDPPDAVFCSADDASSALVRDIRLERPGLPIVAVTELPEQGKWLDALEAGAADYCCAPFDTSQLARLLAGVLHAGACPPAKPSASVHV